MASLKRKWLSFSNKYKAITAVESGAKPSKVAEKYGVPRNAISTWLLPGNKEKIKVLFNLEYNYSGTSLKRTLTGPKLLSALERCPLCKIFACFGQKHGKILS